MKGALVALLLVLLVAIELERPGRRDLEAGAVVTPGVPPVAADDGEPKLTRPQDLLLLEAPDRAVWQKPEQIMDELSIADGSSVADIGAGAGWFTIRLAERVRGGIVYAQDVQPEMVAAITRRITRQGLRNVRVVEGSDTSSGLPSRALDAVLVVDVYAEVERPVDFLRDLARSLKPQGRIGIVNYKPGAGGPGPSPDRRVARDVVERDARAAGLRMISTMDLRYEYLVVLGQATAPAGAPAGSGA